MTKEPGFPTAAGRRHCLRPIATAIVLILLTAATALADSGRVLVQGALVWTRPANGGTILAELNRGDVVELIQRSGEWYQVVIPPGRGTQRVGYLRVTQVEISQQGPLSAEARRLAASAPRAGAPRNRLMYVAADIGYRVGTSDFVRTAPAFAESYAEEGAITANYGNGSGPVFDLMVTQFLSPRFGAGVGVSIYNRTSSARVTAEVPHPLFFDQPRLAEAEVNDIAGTRRTPGGLDAGVHVPLTFLVSSSDRMRLSVYGGPSVFFLKQDVIVDLEFDETYPFETVDVSDFTVEERRGTRFGYHAGADLSWFAGPRYGVGLGVRYAAASIKLRDDAGTTEGRAGGGLQISGGLRVRF